MKSIIRQVSNSSIESSPGFVSVFEHMKSMGYHLSTVTDIDMSVCVDSDCSQCSHTGLQAIGFRTDNRYSYRVFAFCPKCKFWEEF